MEKLIKKLSETLNVDFEKLKSHYEKDFQFVDYNPSYFRFKRNLGSVESGTVAFLAEKGIEIIRGYPKIQRALVIETAFSKNFKEAYVEEKLNGYNVRTAVVDGELQAITRKGLVCEYTSLRIENELNMDFFKDYPDFVLCGEVIGLQNPYQEKSYPEEKDFGYYAFDIRKKGTGEPLNRDEKRDIFEKYRLKSVKELGKFNNGKAVLEKARELGKNGREGVVLKSYDMKKAVKYTANQSTNEDLKYAFKFHHDYAVSFMFRRILREAFQAYELNLSKKELENEASELGKSILIPMVETIRAVEKGINVKESFEITVPDEEFGIDFVHNLRLLGVDAEVDEIRKEGENIVMKISRNYQSTNDKTKNYLEGGFDNE